MAGSKKVFTTLGSSNHALENREAFDYYATDPKVWALYLGLRLLQLPAFNGQSD